MAFGQDGLLDHRMHILGGQDQGDDGIPRLPPEMSRAIDDVLRTGSTGTVFMRWRMRRRYQELLDSR